LYLAGFDLISSGSYMLIPCYIPIISFIANTCIAVIPLLNRLCLHQYSVVRPYMSERINTNLHVSVIIPCRNEAGNIEAAVTRCPDMGLQTEIIFVEGNSTDNTLAEIKSVSQQYPMKKISWLVQDGKGKGDAVRKGFAHAKGDVLMILDGDLTMPPEELPKFFSVLASGKGECINGSRLVYGMESEAMTHMSLLANFGFGCLLSWIMGQRVTDTLCGTKVLWKKDYDRLETHRAFFGTHDPFGDFDILLGAARLQLKIVDVPVHYKKRTYGQTNIRRFWDVWFLLWMSWQALRKFKLR
jgi:glycosyltransferase involved in cell wall biosynthesis